MTETATPSQDNASTPETAKGFLGWVERTGNKLPDPVFIFFYLIVLLVGISVLCAMLGVNATHPTQVDANGDAVIVSAKSLLHADNIQKLWVDMPKTFTHFHPPRLCFGRDVGRWCC